MFKLNLITTQNQKISKIRIILNIEEKKNILTKKIKYIN